MCYKCRLLQGGASGTWLPYPSAAQVRAMQERAGQVGPGEQFPTQMYLTNGLAGTVWSAAPARANPGMRWIL